VELVFCDECNQQVTIDLKEKTHPRGVVEMYFKCNHCYHHYTVAVTNKRVRKLQRRMRDKGIQFIQGGTSKEQEEIVSTMKQLKDNLINYGVADL